MKYVLQYVLSSMVLLFTTLAAWYEGSAIRSNPWEWKYTAYFSEMLHGPVKTKADISQLDHFIYAAKFSPIFPILMVISFSYILVLTCYIILRKYSKTLTFSLASLGILYLFLAWQLADSPTIGGKILTGILLTIAISLLVFSIFAKLRRIGNFRLSR